MYRNNRKDKQNKYCWSYNG